MKRISAEEIVYEINNAKVCGTPYIEDEIDMDGMKEVATVNREEHRWYTIGTVVFQVGEEFLGVRGPIDLKSETMGFDDIGAECEAFEMVVVPSVTYKRKE